MTTPTTVQARFQLRADTAANWTSVNPVLLNNEFGLETDTKKLKVGNGSTAWNSLAYFPSIVSGGTVLGNLEIGTTGTLTFEGSTADGFETTLAVANPTADRTITLPNQSGNVIVSGNASIVNADISASAAIAFSKLASMTAGYVLIGNASNVPTVTQVTGDVTISSSGVTSIASGAIVDADVSASAEIAVSKLADGAARQLLQTDAAGTGVEWTDNVDIPGTLDVTGAATFDGAVTIAGDLTVNGTTTNINTQNLVVEDKNVILGDVATPTDVTADGGGITLKGSTDKTINWVDATDAWTSSERFSIPAGTAGAPSLTITGDENSGIYSPGADQLGFSTGGTGRMFIDASGRLLVGTSTVIANRNYVNAAINPRADLHGVGPSNATIAATQWGTSSTAHIVLSRSKSGTINTRGAVESQDDIAALVFTADDGTNFIPAAHILAEVDGAVATDQMPGRLSFYTTPAASATPTERLRIASDGFISLGGDTDTGFSNPAANNLAFSTGGSERARIDSSGRLLVGTSTSLVGGYSLQVAGTSGGIFEGFRYSDNNSAGVVRLYKSRGTTVGSDVIVQSGDPIGTYQFLGYDGAAYQQAASIFAAVDATPGANDMPGRIVLSTTSDGSASPTERMRINSSGQVLIGRTAASYDTQLEAEKGIYSATGFGNFPYWNYGPVESITIVNGGSGYTDGTYVGIPLLTGGTALGVTANFTVSGGVITAATIAQEGRPEQNYAGAILTLQTGTDLGAGGTGLSLTIASVRTAYYGVYGAPGRIRLGTDDSSIAGSQELGSILFSQRDSSSVNGIAYGGSGDTARIYARGVGTLGGGYFDFWTAANGGQAQSTMWLNYDATNSILTIRNPGDSNSNFVSVLRADQATATTARRGGQITFGRENANSWAASTTDCDGYIAFSPVLDNTNTERMRITSAGLVGIGTTAPSTRLHLEGTGDQALYIVRDTSGGCLFERSDTSLNIVSLSGTSTKRETVFIRDTGSARTESARIDSSGRLLVGTSANIATANDAALAVNPSFQVAGSTGDTCVASIYGYAAAVGVEPQLVFSRSKSGTVGTHTAVASNDDLGVVSFAGSDGTNFVSAASILAEVDGTPGTNDMPGRLTFSTTADGASSPTEQLRITNDGVRGYNQAAPVAVNTTATLTVANLKNGIITSTTAAAVTGTLPTGTLTEGGFSGLYTNFTFEWTVINTGATNNFTVQAGTDHTVVGNMVVAAGNSGRFATRRTAANTFVTYRLSS